MATMLIDKNVMVPLHDGVRLATDRQSIVSSMTRRICLA